MDAHFLRKVHETAGIRGIVTLTNFTIPEESVEAQLADQFLKNAVNISPFQYCEAMETLRQLCPSRTATFHNQVHKSGREVFARLLIDDTTYSGAINYGALGTGSGAISDTDTTLGTEVARKQIATKTRTDDSVTIDFYYSKGDTDGTYEEFGTFIDGTASADSGQMFNRVLTGGWTKTSTEAMTVAIQFDLSAA